jgi:hypothetical protein
MHDFSDAARCDMNGARQRVLTEAHRLQKFLKQNFPWMGQCFETIARRYAKIARHARLVKKTDLRATFWMSGGGFRLRRPDQINSVSESPNRRIMVEYDVTRYDRQFPV